MDLKNPIDLDVFMLSEEDEKIDMLGISLNFNYEENLRETRTFYSINMVWMEEQNPMCSFVSSNGHDYMVDYKINDLKELIKKSR